MKPVYRIILFILICWFGYNAFRQTLEAQQSGLFNVFQHFNLIILVILSIAAIASDIVSYRSYSKLFQFYSSIVAVFICTIIFFRLYTFNKIERSMTLYEFSSKAGSENTLSLQFKENGYLRIEEFFRLGQNIYYGKYYRSNDSFVITQTNYERISQKLPGSAVWRSDYLIFNEKDTFHLEKISVR
ncbi:MAG: hypothetical protein V4685_13050 [Bacteroidota bacterium]